MATLTYSDTDYSGKVRSRLVITYTTTANTNTSYTLSISIKHEVKASVAGTKVESVAGSYPNYGYVLFYVTTNTNVIPKSVTISNKTVTCTAANTWYTLGTYSTTITVSKEKYENEISLDAIEWVSASDYNDGTSYTAVDNVTINKILVTVPALPSYAVKYDANGGSGAPAQQTKYYGTALTLSSTKPTRTNYVFRYWYTTKAGTGGTAYNSGASYTANAAVTLYAQWYAPYTVTYNANGGTGGPTTQTKIYNTNLTLSTSKPTRSGYAFVEWNTKSDGTGASYNSGATYSSNANVTLYAIWAAVPSISSLTAIRCDANGDQDDEGTYANIMCVWTCAENATASGTFTPQSGGSATSFSFTSGASGSGTVTSTAKIGGGNLDTDMQYTVSVTVSCTSSGVTKTATRNVILTRAFFVMDWKRGGQAIGIGRAAPESGLEVGYPATFDADVTSYGNVFLMTKGLYANASEIDYTTTPTATKYVQPVHARDKNGNEIGHCEWAKLTDGKLSHRFAGVRAYFDNAWTWRQCSMEVDTSGNVTYSIQTPDAFCSALHVGDRVAKDQSTAVSAATATWTNIASVSLAAGTWVVTATAQFASNATGRRAAALSTASAAATASDQRQTGANSAAVNGASTYLNVSATKVYTATTTLYLEGWQNSGSALSCYGCITAVRIK